MYASSARKSSDMVIDEPNECFDIEKPSTERAGEQGPGTTVGSYFALGRL
jgi:hypothetical protein